MDSVRIKKPKVYYIKNLTNSKLSRLFELLGREFVGNTGVKIDISNGGKLWTADLVNCVADKVCGTCVDTCVERDGAILSVDGMEKELESLGFMNFGGVDILDKDGETVLEIAKSGNLKGETFVSSGLLEYDNLIILSEVYGEGANKNYGGAINNLSLGLASKGGKMWINSAGFTKDYDVVIDHNDKVENVLISRAEAAKGVVDHFTRANLMYINITQDVAIDGDCGNICDKRNVTGYGIYASLDPVAVDQACFDATTRKSRIKRTAYQQQREKDIEFLLESAESMALGERDYELVEI